MKFKASILFLVAIVLSGCGGESDVTVPKPELKSDQMKYHVFNLVYQGTELNSPNYKPLSLSLSFDNSVTGKQSNATELPNYMFVEGDMFTIPDSEENALEPIDYNLSFMDNSTDLKQGTLTVQFEHSDAQALIFVTGDTTQTQANYDVTLIQKPDTKATAGKFPVYFMNNSADPVKVELYYAGSLYSDATQANIAGHSLSNKIMLDKAEPDAQIKVTDAKGVVTSCAVSDKDLENRDQNAWLLAISPLLHRSQTILNCQPYPI